MARTNKQLVDAFFAALPSGDLPDDLFTDDMTAWTTTSGTNPKARILGGIRMLATLFDGGITYVVDATTAEDDRLVAEVRSHGTLVDGRHYANTQVFIFRFRDGRIASFAEHMNPLVTQEKIVPLLQAAMAKAQG
jgi:ketosteroid isomerase-like protein